MESRREARRLSTPRISATIPHQLSTTRGRWALRCSTSPVTCGAHTRRETTKRAPRPSSLSTTTPRARARCSCRSHTQPARPGGDSGRPRLARIVRSSIGFPAEPWPRLTKTRRRGSRSMPIQLRRLFPRTSPRFREIPGELSEIGSACTGIYRTRPTIALPSHRNRRMTSTASEERVPDRRDAWVGERGPLLGSYIQNSRRCG